MLLHYTGIGGRSLLHNFFLNAMPWRYWISTTTQFKTNHHHHYHHRHSVYWCPWNNINGSLHCSINSMELILNALFVRKSGFEWENLISVGLHFWLIWTPFNFSLPRNILTLHESIEYFAELTVEKKIWINKMKSISALVNKLWFIVRWLRNVFFLFCFISIS